MRSHLLCLALLIPSAASATTFCVSTATEFQTALDTASSNGEDDVILVKPGAYVVDEPLYYFTYENFDLSVSGGWENCVSHHNNPSYTAIDGQSLNGLVSFLAAQDTTGNISVSWLTFRNGTGADGRQPVAIGTLAGWQGTLRVENNVFINLQGRSGSGLTAVALDSDAGEIHVRNNVFANNATDNVTAPIDLIANSTQFAIKGTFVNNTVTGNASGQGDVGGARIVGGAFWHIDANVFWGNAGYDLTLGEGAFLYYNDIGTYTGGTPLGEDHNLSVDPGFVDAATGNYRPGGDSPLVGQGWNDAPDGLSYFDAGGGFRLVGEIVDIGAYELQDRIFAGNFDSL